MSSLSKFQPRTIWFPNQDTYDMIENLRTELSGIECADVFLETKYVPHDLAGVVRVTTIKVTQYE